MSFADSHVKIEMGFRRIGEMEEGFDMWGRSSRAIAQWTDIGRSGVRRAAMRSCALTVTISALLIATVQAPGVPSVQAATPSPFVALDSVWSNVVSAANQGKSPSIAFYG